MSQSPKNPRVQFTSAFATGVSAGGGGVAEVVPVVEPVEPVEMQVAEDLFAENLDGPVPVVAAVAEVSKILLIINNFAPNVF